MSLQRLQDSSGNTLRIYWAKLHIREPVVIVKLEEPFEGKIEAISCALELFASVSLQLLTMSQQVSHYIFFVTLIVFIVVL